MRIRTALLAAACALVPAAAAMAAPAAAPPAAPAAPAPIAQTGLTAPTTAVAVTVARYTFDGRQTPAGIADTSGRGVPLRVRAVDGGAIRYVPRGTGRAVAFPARCAAAATSCARVILEGGDDIDLDPGTRAFRFGATVRATAAQVGTGANVMQKGVATTASQWKMQIGRQGRPNCVLVGRGSTRIYLARASVRVTDGAWHSIACRRAGTTLSILVDGNVRGSTPVPAAVSIGNALPLRVGGRNLTARADQFGGSIDDVYAVLG
jgi:Concanavalin A-like lectin/glucanases superfamily